MDRRPFMLAKPNGPHRHPGAGPTSRGWQTTLGRLRVHFGDVAEAERRKVRKQLERYCGQDTKGMIWITDAMRNLTG